MMGGRVCRFREKVCPGRTMNKRLVIVILVFCMVTFVGLYGFLKPMPEGVSFEGQDLVGNVEFVYDLTYQKDGKIIREQRIFNKIADLVKNAEDFVIIDMFLFNDDYDRNSKYPDLAATLTEALIAQKAKNPDLKVVFITDEINTFYGAYPSNYLEELKSQGVNVVITDLTKLRDSNPLYSGIWRTFMQWSGSGGRGWVANAFSPDSPDVTLRAYFKLFNFKANHRKVVITEKAALITSANPHDASAHHSNIAFIVEGGVLRDIIKSEQAVVDFSGGETTLPAITEKEITGSTHVSVLTEGKIRQHLLEEVRKTMSGDQIKIGMFYLSDRKLIKELLSASARDVDIRLILDPNKDAFGREKNGIPNRPVANELVKKSGGDIKVRWYDTHGEQFHTKLVMIKGKHSAVIFGGSANLTKRNIGDYNLETDLKVTAAADSELIADVSEYFERVWTNTGGSYTVEFEKYQDNSLSKKLIYRFQEWSGISSF